MFVFVFVFVFVCVLVFVFVFVFDVVFVNVFFFFFIFFYFFVFSICLALCSSVVSVTKGPRLGLGAWCPLFQPLRGRVCLVQSLVGRSGSGWNGD